MIVDAHAHLVPPSLIAAIRKESARFPSVRLIEEADGLALGFSGGKPTRPVAKGLSDITGRLGWMTKQKVDRQVVGGWVDMFGYQLPPAEGEAWCRLANEVMLSTVKEEPRFVPLASAPMQDGKRAAAVLKQAMAAGFRGAMISTLPRGIGSVLDDPDLDPFWAAADEEGAVILIHPSFDAGDTRVEAYGLANAVGRISDALVAVSRLVCSGHIAKYANARFFAPMGGSALPFVAGRLKRHADLTPGLPDPLEALHRLYTDTVVHDPRVLKFVIEMMGSERLLMGSDMPFPIGDLAPVEILHQAGLKPDQIASITGGLAVDIFRLA